MVTSHILKMCAKLAIDRVKSGRLCATATTHLLTIMTELTASLRIATMVSVVVDILSAFHMRDAIQGN